MWPVVPSPSSSSVFSAEVIARCSSVVTTPEKFGKSCSDSSWTCSSPAILAAWAVTRSVVRLIVGLSPPGATTAAAPVWPVIRGYSMTGALSDTAGNSDAIRVGSAIRPRVGPRIGGT